MSDRIQEAIRSRHRAGETVEELATDYGMLVEEIREVVMSEPTGIKIYQAHVFSEVVLEDVVLYADHVRVERELARYQRLFKETPSLHLMREKEELRQQLATAQAAVWEQVLKILRELLEVELHNLAPNEHNNGGGVAALSYLISRVEQQAQQAREGT